MRQPVSLSKWIDGLQSSGRYTFSREAAHSATRVSLTALKFGLSRLVAKGRLIAPRRGFYVIIPLEYASTGTLPADWFIDDLMKHFKCPYYVGLLSAAELHGAAHQRPQEFQVVTTTAMRPVKAKRTRIRFFVKSHLTNTPTVLVKTTTGMIPVSTPEATAFDLVRYVGRVAGLDHVATVLTELSDRISPRALLSAARKEPDLSTVQRTGYLLDKFGSVAVTGPLAKWLSGREARFVPLRPERKPTAQERDLKWRLIVNAEVEPDI